MSNNANVAAAIKEVAHKVFGGYAELLRMPHTARFSIGSVIACMPFPMVGMTITISVQHYYGNYSLAGVLTAIQAIALAVSSPLLGKLVDKFGQRQVSIPTILVWIVAAIALTTSITNRAPVWVLYCLTPFLAAIPPWGAMSRARWTTMLKGDRERTDRALSLSGVFDECMWIIGNPLASTLAVISGLLAFSFTGVCVVIGALMFLTELTTEPKSQTQLAREAGLTREEYRKRESKIDRMQEEITAYLVQLAQRELTLPQSRMIPVLTHCANDAERLADYAELVLKEAARLAERREKFSKKSEKELRTLFDLTGRMASKVLAALEKGDEEPAGEARELGREIRRQVGRMVNAYPGNLRKGSFNVESGIIFLSLAGIFRQAAERLDNIAVRASSLTRYEWEERK